MASMVGEYFSAPTQFHTMITTTALHHQQSRESAHYLSNCSTREPAADRRSSSSPRYRSHHAPHPPAAPRSASETIPLRDIVTPCEQQAAPTSSTSPTGGASRFPSPPSSSSPKAADSAPGQTHNAPRDPPMAQLTHEAPGPETTTTMPPATTSSAPGGQQPSPSSDSGAAAQQPHHEPPAPLEGYPAHDGQDAAPTSQGKTVHVRDLSHIRSLARADLIAGNETGPLGDDAALHHMKYDISGMPIADVIEMVAALLTKITSTNDLQHDAIQRNVTHQQQAVHGGGDDSSSRMSPLSSSVLAFHGKNVPSITILSYLSRIHRYCPTTYEVFLSLLVYFDRMTERVNDLVVKSEEERRREALRGAAANTASSNGTRRSSASLESRMRDAVMRDDIDAMDSDPDLVDDDDDDDDEEMTDGAASSSMAESEAVVQPATYFVVDSFNIHRLIIAGVTCASKFFSDVFYTNSRYAKVGGLPLPELNHLELQFLLLNDFQLFVPVEDLEAYATMLVEFYAREIVAQASTEE